MTNDMLNSDTPPTASVGTPMAILVEGLSWAPSRPCCWLHKRVESVANSSANTADAPGTRCASGQQGCPVSSIWGRPWN